MYISNEESLLEYNITRKSVLRMLFTGYPFLSISAFFMYYGHNNKEGGTAYFWVAIFPFFLFAFIGISYGSLRMLQKWNKTIKEIRIEKNILLVNTFSILWLKSKEYSFQFEDFLEKQSKFDWYGKQSKNGTIITIDNNIPLFLVEDFFNDYESIVSQLTKNKSI